MQLFKYIFSRRASFGEIKGEAVANPILFSSDFFHYGEFQKMVR